MELCKLRKQDCSKPLQRKQPSAKAQKRETKRNSLSQERVWEAARRKKFNDELETLRLEIPDCAVCPKVSIVKGAVAFIRQCKNSQTSEDELQSIKSTVADLRHINKQLKKKNLLLTLVIREAGIVIEIDRKTKEISFTLPVMCLQDCNGFLKKRKVFFDLSMLQADETDFEVPEGSGIKYNKITSDRETQTYPTTCGEDNFPNGSPSASNLGDLDSEYCSFDLPHSYDTGGSIPQWDVSQRTNCANPEFRGIERILQMSPNEQIKANEQIVIEGEKDGYLTLKILSGSNKPRPKPVMNPHSNVKLKAKLQEHRETLTTAVTHNIPSEDNQNSSVLQILKISCANEQPAEINQVCNNLLISKSILGNNGEVQIPAATKNLYIPPIPSAPTKNVGNLQIVPQLPEGNLTVLTPSLSNAPIMSTGANFPQLQNGKLIQINPNYSLICLPFQNIPKLTKPIRIAPKPESSNTTASNSTSSQTSINKRLATTEDVEAPSKRSKLLPISKTYATPKIIPRVSENYLIQTNSTNDASDPPDTNSEVVGDLQSISASTFTSLVAGSGMIDDEPLGNIMDLPCVIPEGIGNNELGEGDSEDNFVEMLCSIDDERPCNFMTASLSPANTDGILKFYKKVGTNVGNANTPTVLKRLEGSVMDSKPATPEPATSTAGNSKYSINSLCISSKRKDDVLPKSDTYSSKTLSSCDSSIINAISLESVSTLPNSVVSSPGDKATISSASSINSYIDSHNTTLSKSHKKVSGNVDQAGTVSSVSTSTDNSSTLTVVPPSLKKLPLLDSGDTSSINKRNVPPPVSSSSQVIIATNISIPNNNEASSTKSLKTSTRAPQGGSGKMNDVTKVYKSESPSKNDKKNIAGSLPNRGPAEASLDIAGTAAAATIVSSSLPILPHKIYLPPPFPSPLPPLGLPITLSSSTHSLYSYPPITNSKVSFSNPYSNVLSSSSSPKTMKNSKKDTFPLTEDPYFVAPVISSTVPSSSSITFSHTLASSSSAVSVPSSLPSVSTTYTSSSTLVPVPAPLLSLPSSLPLDFVSDNLKRTVAPVSKLPITPIYSNSSSAKGETRLASSGLTVSSGPSTVNSIGSSGILPLTFSESSQAFLGSSASPAANFTLAPISSYTPPFPFCGLSLADAPTTFSFTLTHSTSNFSCTFTNASTSVSTLSQASLGKNSSAATANQCSKWEKKSEPISTHFQPPSALISAQNKHSVGLNSCPLTTIADFIQTSAAQNVKAASTSDSISVSPAMLPSSDSSLEFSQCHKNDSKLADSLNPCSKSFSASVSSKCKGIVCPTSSISAPASSGSSVLCFSPSLEAMQQSFGGGSSNTNKAKRISEFSVPLFPLSAYASFESFPTKESLKPPVEFQKPILIEPLVHPHVSESCISNIPVFGKPSSDTNTVVSKTAVQLNTSVLQHSESTDAPKTQFPSVSRKIPDTETSISPAREVVRGNSMNAMELSTEGQRKHVSNELRKSSEADKSTIAEIDSIVLSVAVASSTPSSNQIKSPASLKANSEMQNSLSTDKNSSVLPPYALPLSSLGGKNILSGQNSTDSLPPMVKTTEKIKNIEENSLGVAQNKDLNLKSRGALRDTAPSEFSFHEIPNKQFENPPKEAETIQSGSAIAFQKKGQTEEPLNKINKKELFDSPILKTDSTVKERWPTTHTIIPQSTVSLIIEELSSKADFYSDKESLQVEPTKCIMKRNCSSLSADICGNNYTKVTKKAIDCSEPNSYCKNGLNSVENVSSSLEASMKEVIGRSDSGVCTLEDKNMVGNSPSKRSKELLSTLSTDSDSVRKKLEHSSSNAPPVADEKSLETSSFCHLEDPTMLIQKSVANVPQGNNFPFVVMHSENSVTPKEQRLCEGMQKPSLTSSLVQKETFSDTPSSVVPEQQPQLQQQQQNQHQQQLQGTLNRTGEKMSKNFNSLESSTAQTSAKGDLQKCHISPSKIDPFSCDLTLKENSYLTPQLTHNYSQPSLFSMASTSTDLHSVAANPNQQTQLPMGSLEHQSNVPVPSHPQHYHQNSVQKQTHHSQLQLQQCSHQTQQMTHQQQSTQIKMVHNKQQKHIPSLQSSQLPHSQQQTLQQQKQQQQQQIIQHQQQQQQLIQPQQILPHPQQNAQIIHQQHMQPFGSVMDSPDSIGMKVHSNNQLNHSPMDSSCIQPFDYNPNLCYRKMTQSPRSNGRIAYHTSYKHFPQCLGETDLESDQTVASNSFIDDSDGISMRTVEENSDPIHYFSVSHLVSQSNDSRKNSNSLALQKEQSPLLNEDKNKDNPKSKLVNRKQDGKSRSAASTAKGSHSGDSRRRSPARNLTAGQQNNNLFTMWHNKHPNNLKQGHNYSAEALIGSQNYARSHRQPINQNYPLMANNQMYQSAYSPHQVKNFVQNSSFTYSPHDRNTHGNCNTDYNFQLHSQGASSSLPYGSNMPYMTPSYPYQNLPPTSADIMATHPPSAYPRFHDIGTEQSNFHSNATFPVSLDSQEVCGGTGIVSAAAPPIRMPPEPSLALPSSSAYYRSPKCSLSSNAVGGNASSSPKRARFSESNMVGSSIATPTNFLEGSALPPISIHSFTPPCEDPSLVHSGLLSGPPRQGNFFLGTDNFMPFNASGQFQSGNNSGGSSTLSMPTNSMNSIGMPGVTNSRTVPPGNVLPVGHLPHSPLKMDRQMNMVAPSAPHLSSSLSNFNLTSIIPDIDRKNEDANSLNSSSGASHVRVAPMSDAQTLEALPSLLPTISSSKSSSALPLQQSVHSYTSATNNSINNLFAHPHQVGLPLNAAIPLPTTYAPVNFPSSDN